MALDSDGRAGQPRREIAAPAGTAAPAAARNAAWRIGTAAGAGVRAACSSRRNLPGVFADHAETRYAPSSVTTKSITASRGPAGTSGNTWAA